MQPVVIDVVGTIKQLVKAVLVEVLLFLAVIAFALSAPLLFTVVPLRLVSQYPDSAGTLALVYLCAGPFACAVWMVFISHWPDWVSDWKIRRAGGRGYRTWDERAAASAKGTWFMFSGLFGSFVAGFGFTYVAHVTAIIPDHIMLYFTLVPFAVFAPCWIVVLRRWIRRDEYATE